MPLTVYAPSGTTFSFQDSLASGEFRISSHDGNFHVKLSTGVRFEIDPNLIGELDVRYELAAEGFVNSPYVRVDSPLPPPGMCCLTPPP